MNSNKLIAEFMGLTTEVFNSGNLNYYFKEFNSGTWYEEHELSYNTSWDWLMTVVEKIESLRDVNGNAYRFTIDMCNAQIEGTNIEILGGAFKIDTTYKAVIQFIKVNKIEVLISKLKSAYLDGETTQYILEQIGMDYQMYKQLNVKYNNK
jgi:hypothetical protein